jgi:hypothetical protein
MAMPKIFISYRRDDVRGAASRLGDALCAEFGRDSVFLDIDNIPMGMDFRNALEYAFRDADVMLTLIGRKWLTSGYDGQRRIDDPADFVRLEIEYALRMEVPVIPVLVDHAAMPRPNDLPPSLRQLTHRNAIALSDVNFRADVERLVNALRQMNADHVELPAPRWKLTTLSIFARLLGIDSAVPAQKATKTSENPIQAVSALPPTAPVSRAAEQDEAFMSYSRDDAGMMQKVCQRLAKSEISVWTDAKLEPGTPSWKKAVQSAIESSTCFIILLTPNAKNSDIVEMELGYALAHERIILPILADGTNRTAVPLEIINRQWTDIREDFELGMTRLVQSVLAYRSGTTAQLPRIR